MSTHPTLFSARLQRRPSTRRRAAAMAMAALGLAAGLVSVSSPALAASRNGVCEAGEFCLYYNSNFLGSVSDFTTSITDYGATQPSCYEFKGTGAGQGQCVKNNAASAWNRTGTTVTVFFNSNYGGADQVFASGSKANLNATLKNENASHRIGGSGTTKVDMSTALYQSAGARLTCAFNCYAGHEGIDIARYEGAPVFALLSGRVTRVTEGFSGPDGLSTIAVYNANLNKTIIYLHTNPSNSLAVGTAISRGTQIGNEALRGKGTGTHTHVEMRLGEHTAAASSSDGVLTNPNPNTFWQSQGYNVR